MIWRSCYLQLLPLLFLRDGWGCWRPRRELLSPSAPGNISEACSGLGFVGSKNNFLMKHACQFLASTPNIQYRNKYQSSPTLRKIWSGAYYMARTGWMTSSNRTNYLTPLSLSFLIWRTGIIILPSCRECRVLNKTSYIKRLALGSPSENRLILVFQWEDPPGPETVTAWAILGFLFKFVFRSRDVVHMKTSYGIIRKTAHYFLRSF